MAFKVIQLTTDEKIKNILVFLPKGDNYSKKIKTILSNVENRQRPSKEDIHILTEEFGKDWKRKLGIEALEGRAKDAEVAVVDMFSASRVGVPLKGGDDEESLYQLLEPEKEPLPIEEIPTKRAKELQIQFIYHPINWDDKINIIKEKIYGFGENYSPPLALHLLKIGHNDIFRDNLIETNLEYGIFDVRDRNITYESRILPLLNSNVKELPIDHKFVEKFFVDKSLSIGNLSKQIIGKEVDTIYVVDLMELLLSKYQSIEKIKAYFLEEGGTDFYNGFILKYFPSIKDVKEEYQALLGGVYTPLESKETIRKKYEEIQKEIELINEKNKTILSDKEINNPSVLSTIININFETFFRKEPTLNLRALFEFFPLNDIVVFMKYRKPYEVETSIINKVYYSVDEYNFKNWASTGIGLGIIMFKIKNPNRVGHYTTLLLYEDGKMKLEISWGELQKAKLDEVNAIFDTLNKYLIDVINGMETIFLVNRPKLPQASWDNSSIVNLNLLVEINDPKIILDETIYRETLPILTKIFQSYVALDLSKKISLERNISLLYWKYLRSSYFNPKSVHQGGINNMISSGEQEIASGLEAEVLFPQEEEGIETSLKGQNYPKIGVNGVKSIQQAQPIFEFIAKMIYMALNINKLIENNSKWSFLANKYKVYKRLSKTSEAGLRIVKGKQVKKVKVLQQIDPRLFDYNTKGKNIEFYSRICQTNAQPTVINTTEEVKKLDPKRVLEYDNKTYKGQRVYYYCENHKYKYPSFKVGKHPDGFCLPCCFKTYPLENPKSNTYKNHKKCLGEEDKAIEPEPPRVAVNRYIIQWGKIVPEARFGFPSSSLFQLFNMKMECRISKDVNQLERNSNCFLIYGIKQFDGKAFFRAVATAIYGGNKFDDYNKPEIRHQIEGFLDKTIDYLSRNEQIFDILENGAVKKEFGTLKEYIKFLKGPSLDKEIYAKDLISRFNIEYLDKNGLSILIFSEDEIGEATFKCFNYNLDEERNFIIITKNTFQNTYNPVVLVQTDASALPKITISRVFNPEKEAILHKTLIKLYKALCLSKISKELSLHRLKEIKGVEVIGIYSSSLDGLSADYVLIRYINKEFFFPIKVILVNKPLSIFEPFKEIERLPTLKFLEDFLKKELNLHIYHLLILKENPKVQVALLDGNNLPVFIKSSHQEGYPSSVINYDLLKINKSIKENKFIEDVRIKEIKEYNYEQEKYNSYLLLLSRSLTQEKDHKKRKELIHLVEKQEPLRKVEQYEDILRNIEWRTTEDFNKFRRFLWTAFRKGLKRAMRIFNSLSFSFDTKKEREMIETIYSKLSEPQKIERLRELIKGVMKGKVKYINSDEAHSIKKIKYILYQEPLELSKELEEKFLEKITQELALNDIAQEIIFNGFIDPILDAQFYSKKPKESVLEVRLQ